MAARHSKKELFNDLVPEYNEQRDSEQERSDGERSEQERSDGERSEQERSDCEQSEQTEEDIIEKDMEEMSDEQSTAKEQYLAAVKLLHQSDEVMDDKHVKRICVTMPPDLYDYLCIESRRRGMKLTGFLNMIVKEYKNGINAHILL